MSGRFCNFRKKCGCAVPAMGTALFAAVLAVACGPAKGLQKLESEQPSASINIVQQMEMPVQEDDFLEQAEQQVTFEERTMTVMQAVYDAESREMVANERIKAAVVTARFLNVAERDGKVNICFEIKVPEAMQDKSWQVRFYPMLEVGRDTMNLEQVLITGEEYRNRQMRGYELYDKFLKSILDDDEGYFRNFVSVGPMEIFIERNLPELWKMKSDTTYFDVDTSLTTMFGVSYSQIVQHYTKSLKLRWNTYKKNSTERMYHRYIKDPLIVDGVRLDSVIRNINGDLSYHYSQVVPITDDIRKIYLSLDGDIWKQGERIYTMPQCDRLTYYISTLASLASGETKYRKKIVYRNSTVNGRAKIAFLKGRHEYVETFSDNGAEMARIEEIARKIIFQSDLVLDSVLISASCSPEGSWKANDRLASLRSREIEKQFTSFLDGCRKEQEMQRRLTFSLDTSWHPESPIPPAVVDIRSRQMAEDWELLEKLCLSDNYLEREWPALREVFAVSEPDARERRLSTLPDFAYIRDSLYPLLRKVDFSFYTHIPNMVKDTVQTDEIDTLYMEGINALRRRDYKSAVTLLRPYEDLNSAIALLSMNYNHSALEILQKLPQTDTTLYMQAIAHHRLGQQRQAEESYLKALELNPRLVHRANLDPEISSWARKYAPKEG